jgi:hypothetical protein
MAAFCLAMRMSPEDYRRLTLRERDAFISAFEERHDG